MNRATIKLIVSVLLVLLVCVVISACGSASDSNQTGDKETNDSDPVESTKDSSLPESSDMSPATSNSAPETTPPKMLTDVTYTVPEDGVVSVPSASYVSGHLIAVSENYKYSYNVSSLVKNSEIKSSNVKFPSQNLMIVYGSKKAPYLLANSKIFVKSDAFSSLEALMDAFNKDTGEDFIQLVSAYTYSDDDSLYSPFVTGYSIALNILDGSTYPLTSVSKKVTVGGTTMTVLEWFQLHCAEHGFIYTGMSGTEGYALATFRYVGIPHATIMYEKDIIDLRYYSNNVQVSGGLKTVIDGVEWTVEYFPVSDSEYTEFSLTPGYIYTVSGNNVDGFIIAYHAPVS